MASVLHSGHYNSGSHHRPVLCRVQIHPVRYRKRSEGIYPKLPGQLPAVHGSRDPRGAAYGSADAESADSECRGGRECSSLGRGTGTWDSGIRFHLHLSHFVPVHHEGKGYLEAGFRYGGTVPAYDGLDSGRSSLGCGGAVLLAADPGAGHRAGSHVPGSHLAYGKDYAALHATQRKKRHLLVLQLRKGLCL